MDASDWTALGSLVLASATALGALIGYRRNQAGVRAAEEKAERATGAAERSAAAHERMALATEMQQIQVAALAPSPCPAWQLSAVGGHGYLLENVGTGNAFDVQVQPAHESLSIDIGDLPSEVMGPNDSVKFHAFLSLATSDDRIVVTWKQRPDSLDREEWFRTLPRSR